MDGRCRGVGLARMPKMMIKGSRPRPPYEQPSDDPLRQNSVLDIVVGMIAFGPVANFGSGDAPHFCLPLAGCPRARGEPHLLFPPDDRPRRIAQQMFVARQRLLSEDMSVTCQRWPKEWFRVEREWGGGNHLSRFQFASDAPVRFFVGGPSGNRFLGPTPRPSPRQLRSVLRQGAAPASGVPFERIDVSMHGAQGLAQRTRFPSVRRRGGVLLQGWRPFVFAPIH